MRQQLLSQSVRGTRHRHERHLHHTASALTPSRLRYLAGRWTHLLDAAHVIAVELSWEHLHALLHRESAWQRTAIHLTAQQAISTRCGSSQSTEAGTNHALKLRNDGRRIGDTDDERHLHHLHARHVDQLLTQSAMGVKPRTPLAF